VENFTLKVFRTVADKRNFTDAAEVLFLTQPAISLQIKSLEESLGVQLFDRSGKRVSLTAAGEVLLRYANLISELTDQARREIGLLQGEERGRLVLGASTTIAQYLLPRLVGEFTSKNPQVDLSIVGGNTERIVQALLDRQVELGLIEGPAGTRELKTERFLDDELALIVSPRHAWVREGASRVNVDALAGAPLILREHGSGTRRVVEEALRASGLKMKSLNVVLELDSTEAIKAAVEAGLGMAFVSRWALTKDVRLGSLGILDLEGVSMRRTFSFAYRQGPDPAGTAGAFLRFARECRSRVALPGPNA
jgi:DNA-binding transcriptional LysR family regulator